MSYERMLGRTAVFRGIAVDQNQQPLPAPVYYVDIEKEVIVGEEQWT